MTSAPKRAKRKTAARKTVARKPAARKTAKPAPTPTLKNVILAALEDMKAHDIKTLDVRGLTDVADTMIIASGTSDRHVRSVAERDPAALSLPYLW